MKSGNLNFLEPFGLLQACNGTALLLYDKIINCLAYFFTYTKAVLLYDPKHTNICPLNSWYDF